MNGFFSQFTGSAMLRFTALCFSCIQVNAQEVVTQLDETFHFAEHKTYLVDSKILKRKYKLSIKVPKSYSSKKNKDKTYPVLYLNDAPYTFKVAAGVTHFGAMDKAIIVGI